ncbi:MAG TPA: YraN family protein [Bacteroidia bacterium]|jgi:putative endonuclease
MAEHNDTGLAGELLAAAFLKSKGYKVLETNWRFKNLEADIIASIGDTMVVAEVKTRKSNYFGEPETFVNRQKQRNLIKAAHEYIIQKDLSLEVRFDIISIVMNSSGNAVNHIEAAFYPLV